MRASPRAVTLIGFDTSMAVDGRVRDPAVGRAGPHARRPTRSGCSARPAHSAELLPALAGLLEQGGYGLGRGDRDRGRRGAGHLHRAADRRRHRARPRQGLGVPLHPVSSLEALAAGIAAGAAAAPGTPLLPLIDAKRGQVFASLHRAGEPLETRVGPACPRLPSDLDERIARAAQPPLAAGDWALESLERLEAAGSSRARARIRPARHRSRCRSAGSAREADPCAPERVHPVYVRQPDAEITRSARHEARRRRALREAAWPDDPRA